MDYSIITKYLEGKASETEIQEIFQWMEADPENKKELVQLKKIWAITSRAGEDSQKAWNKLLTQKMNPKPRVHSFSVYLKYAAAALLIFSLGIAVQYIISDGLSGKLTYLADTQINVPAGQMSDVVLPDGTSVRLNSGSKLIYPSTFSSGERVVQLDGEAFFDVTKDTQHPFLVKTKSLDFKVYGTSFNIQAYSDEEEVNTTLVDGSLGVMGKNGNEFTRLIPGENMSYRNQTKEIQVGKVTLDMYVSWKDGLITFRNESLKNIAKKIERWYNVEIIIQNEKLANELYMGTIMKNKPIDQILEVFRLTSSLKYRVVQRPDKPALIYWE